MASLQPWAIGKHYTAFTLTPQTYNPTTGALTDTTPVATCYGLLDEVEIESKATLENLSPMDRGFENNVVIEKGSTYRCSVFNIYVGANVLARAAYGADYFKVVVTRGDQTWTGYGTAGNYRESGRKSRSMGSFELQPIDIGGTSANPSYV